MIFLVFLIHVIFSGIFFFFGRYVEMGVVVCLFLLFLSKTLPSIDIFKKPDFFRSEVSEHESLSQSLFFGSGVLFYLALIGISLTASEYFDISSNLRLFQYCIFFLTSVIYTVYLVFYPRNPSIFMMLRTHTMLVASFLSLMAGMFLIFDLAIPSFMFVNMLMILIGLMATILLDRTLSIRTHLAALGIFLLSATVLVVSFVSEFTDSIAPLLASLSILTALIYVFFSHLLKRVVLVDRQKELIWYNKNTSLGFSWILFACLFYGLFWETLGGLDVILFSMIILLIFWSWVYATDEGNPLFFSGNALVLSSIYGYILFRVVPPHFWTLLVCLFLFVGVLLFFSRFFQNKPEELILALTSIVFLCIADFVFLFSGRYGLFHISVLFLLQSFLWYGVYEVLHRHTYAKNSMV